MFHRFHTGLARTSHFLPLRSASQTQVTSPFGTVECRRVLGLPPHGKVQRKLCSWKAPRRLQTDFPYQVLVTSGHTTVWQNKVTLQVRCLAMLQQWL